MATATQAVNLSNPLATQALKTTAVASTQLEFLSTSLWTAWLARLSELLAFLLEIAHISQSAKWTMTAKNQDLFAKINNVFMIHVTTVQLGINNVKTMSVE